MKYENIKALLPTIERRLDLPESRAKDLKRRVRATELAVTYAAEFYRGVMNEAQIDQDEAWDECAELMGFKDLDDLTEQGFGMVLIGSQLQLRKQTTD